MMLYMGVGAGILAPFSKFIISSPKFNPCPAKPGYALSLQTV